MSTRSPTANTISGYRIVRLRIGDGALAQRVFAMMTSVFEEPAHELGDAYLDGLLAREHVWLLAALTTNDEPVGGLTAHVLPMTRAEQLEVFIYDLAVHTEHQRRGVGRLLIRHAQALAAAAGIEELVVPADVEDEHALAFYRAVGGSESAVSFFAFRGARAHS